jgi:hypothetical protein
MDDLRMLQRDLIPPRRLKTVNLDPNTLRPEVSLQPEPHPLTMLSPEEMYIKPMKPQERVTKLGPFISLDCLRKRPWRL